MTTNHNQYLDIAFQIAEKNLGKTNQNPSVGCVVVKNGSVISSGLTSKNGRPHSEFNALRKLKNCTGASLYTTLEPCAHKGKTPPCVDIIIKKKIKNVYYAFEDPDIRTFKKSKKILKLNGIKSKLVPSKKYKKFYKSYFLNKKNFKPYVSAKIAFSKDYKTINTKNKWITNENSRKVVHLLRSQYDCILSTSKSINYDNARLNCRIQGLDNNKPDLFIVDLKLKLKKKLIMNKLLKKRKTYLITLKENFNKISSYKKLGYKTVFINSLKEKKDFNILYERIYKMGYSRILVEAGLSILNNLLKNKLINDLYIFKTNNKLGKNGRNNDYDKYLKKLLPKPLTINLNNDKLFKIDF
jgi:diaminohydroxyphosphoribosylaminopyrimidine deaminase/5-amino-6-(5-phosphoribosylamino)uracil reductase